MARRASNRLADEGLRIAAGPIGALLIVLLATVARLWLGHWFPRLTPFSLYYPAILLAALLGGAVSAAFALFLSLLLSWAVLLRAVASSMDIGSQIANLLIFLFTGSAFALTGARLRGLLRRQRVANAKLAERELRYRTLFEGMSDGFALIEGVWSADGRLVDFVVLEANPALSRLFKTEATAIGRSLSVLQPNPVPGYLAANERAFKGETLAFAFETPRSHRWFELRLCPVGENRVAQIVVDITDRKAAELRQTELFDELNHRVKNNLAMVSAILGMQSRVTESAEVREHLQNAVARIHAIADVHGSLYRSSRKDDVDLAAYLQHLCERLSSSLVDRSRVRIEVATDPAVAPLDDAVALGLVVNELVTNAAKYAYPGSGGVVKVTLRNTPDGLRLTVSDEGQGLSAGGGRSGLGMRLVRSLVQQCGGVLKIHEGPGAAFTVELRPTGAQRPVEAAQTRLL